jgi:kynurenine 3-monooxygenase
VVPFYGQGANAAFEDTVVFSELLDRTNGDLAAAVSIIACTCTAAVALRLACVQVAAFSHERQPATDALADLSMDNYVEMRHRTATVLHVLRKHVEGVLQRLFRSWLPQYSRVTFTREPYNLIVQNVKRQELILDFMALAGFTLTAAVLTRIIRRNTPAVVGALRGIWGQLLAATSKL